MLQRGLPRPKTLDSLPAVRPEASLHHLGLKEAAETLLQNELVLLLQHDAAKYPIKVGHGMAEAGCCSCAVRSPALTSAVLNAYETVAYVFVLHQVACVARCSIGRHTNQYGAFMAITSSAMLQ